jgi:hypothetical protein
MVRRPSRLRSLLVAEAERARIAIDADCSAISVWDRDGDVLRTLVNAGQLMPGDDRFPESELYPLDTFPTMAVLLRDGRAYLNPADVSSLAVAAFQRYGSHAAVPVDAAGERWGELWAGRAIGRPPLTALDLDRLHLVADRLGAALSPFV